MELRKQTIVGSGVDQTMENPHGYDAYHQRQMVALVNASVMLDFLSCHVVDKNTGVRSRPKKAGRFHPSVSTIDVLVFQSLTTVLGSCLRNVICQSIVLFEDLLVSTTLPMDDTLNLYTYAILRLTPSALSSNGNSWSYLRKGGYVNADTTLSSANGAASAERYSSRSRDTSPGGQNQMHHNFRPLQREKLSKGKDGFVAADFVTTEIRGAVPLNPILWFHQAEERMYLCVYQHKNLTILLVIPASSLINGEEGIAHVKRHLLENASQNIVTVEQKLSRGWGGENAYHVGGYRYILSDPNRKVSRASPPGKVITLSKFECDLGIPSWQQFKELEDFAPQDAPLEDEPETPHILLHAITGLWNIRVTDTIQLRVTIDTRTFIALLDTDPAHSFIDSTALDALVLTPESRNGDKVASVGLYRGLTASGSAIDCFVLPLGDFDWLYSLRLICGISIATTLSGLFYINSRDSLLALNRLRGEIDLEKSRAKRSDPTHDKDYEVCIRAKNNAWIIAKISRGKELYMAIEKGGETLLYASTAVEKFSNSDHVKKFSNSCHLK
ncbi:unnamed protein product [Triticum turgidum subsp. durum]|uniref:Uncharacterized protein n=1 Tax=Triticum turgidum subsp. durum TaxID=4567 RepID=A0A9R0TG31_TRITD|nr:unnamed protein product [Triticum turgidum subsp. durum]